METFTPVQREGDAPAEVLRRARGAVDPVLRAAVDSLPPAMCRIAAYHFGWQAADGGPAQADAGKAIRPALLLATADALSRPLLPTTDASGGPETPTLARPVAATTAARHPAPAARDAAIRRMALATQDTAFDDPMPGSRAATAVELVHNFTLLHDDVMDRDLARRHRPTAWAVFGVPDAILAGDALQALALRLLAEDPHPAAPEAASRLAACVIEICEGQHSDCSFEGRTDVALDECLTMAEAKTGALLGCACALGGLYAGAPDAAVAALDRLGRELGLAFQLVDDLLGIWGDPAVTGKPAGADLAVRKKSLPVVAALTAGTPAAAELAALYDALDPLEECDVLRAADLVDRAGGRDWARSEANARMASAADLLGRTIPDTAAAADLRALADLITRRDR